MTRERNILITIEYDGSDFCGWQIQPNVRTVQGDLEKVLTRVCGAPVKLNGTSRTDAGVHALGQRASFKGSYGIPPDKIAEAANNILAGGRKTASSVGDVKITDVKEVPADFHARFSSRGKKYRYVIYNGGNVDIFRRNYCYQVMAKLDTDSMNKACSYIKGTHDFAVFQASGGPKKKTTVRTVHSLDVFRKGEDVIIEITGDGFLYNMVRIITGTLVEVGLGKRQPQDVRDMIDSKDRKQAGHTAPPEGLYLVEVYYEQEI